MVKKIIEISPLAKDKLKEIVNGSKEKVTDFFENVDKHIDEKRYELLFEGKKSDFYYKKCKNIYVIFIIKENAIGIIDFLTKTELEEFKK